MSGLLTHPTWMEMDYAALGSNIAALRRRLAPGTRLIASVKANAYGHGIIEVARRLAELAIDTLATGSLRDALAVREAGIGADIIMLGATLPEGIPQLLQHGFVPTVHTMELARSVSRAARGPARVYVKVDCGHGRLGFPVDGAKAAVEAIARLPGVCIEGIYTHLPFSDARGLAWAREGLARFDALLAALAGGGLSIPVSQARSSAAILTNLTDTCNAVCPGGLIYGKSPLDEDWQGAAEYRPVLSAVRTRLIHISHDPSASRYAGRLRGAGPTGVVPFGRCDGHRPALPPRTAQMLLRGRRVPVLGISLEHAVLDLSDIAEPRLGEVTTVLGADGDGCISLHDIAQWQGVTDSDVLMGLNGRLPRIEVAKVN
jgi:alanine racemase